MLDAANADAQDELSPEYERMRVEQLNVLSLNYLLTLAALSRNNEERAANMAQVRTWRWRDETRLFSDLEHGRLSDLLEGE